jgi:hypothetical protein
MNWDAKYPKSGKPALEQIAEYIASPLWQEFCAFVEEGYGVTPQVEYSICSGAPGWNVKYKKGGRSLCTLYPQPGFYIALVVLGNREMPEAELMMPSCSAYTRELFQKTPFSCCGKWLMLYVQNPEVLGDAKKLIGLRARSK